MSDWVALSLLVLPFAAVLIYGFAAHGFPFKKKKTNND